jgi:hypothetical protein
MRSGFVRTGLVLAGLAMAGPTLATSWLSLPLPPGAEATWVIREGAINGIPSQVQELLTPQAPAEVLAFYRRQFEMQGGLPNPGAARGWHSLAMHRDPINLLVQVQAGKGGGARVLLSQMDLRASRREVIPSELPPLPGARLMQSTESRDGGRRSRYVNFSSAESFDLLTQRLRGHWQRRGWRAAFDDVRPLKGGARQWLASFEGPKGSTVDLVLAPMPDSRELSLTVNLLDGTP